MWLGLPPVYLVGNSQYALPSSVGNPGVLENLPEYRSYPLNTPNDLDVDPEVDPLSGGEISNSQEALDEDEDDLDDEAYESLDSRDTTLSSTNEQFTT